MYIVRNLLSRRSDVKVKKVLRKWQHTAAAARHSATTSNDDLNKVRPVFRYADEHAERIALCDTHGDYTYRSLFCASVALSKQISQLLGQGSQERVAFLCPNDASYVITQWAAWMSGQIVVPLSPSHPQNLLEYYITDSSASVVISTAGLAETVSKLSTRDRTKHFILDEEIMRNAIIQKEVKSEDLDSAQKAPEPAGKLDAGQEPEFYQNNDAMIIYTSGTTGPPKGVVVSHQNVHAQVHGMISSWGWTKKDSILHTLPLYHVHGITNALVTPLTIGAKVVMLPQWSASEVWSYLLSIKKAPEDKVNVFMGVPTMYSKLIQEYDTLFADNKRQVEFIRAVLSQKIRLFVSGSAPLPEPLMTRWHQISGHTLLERYGMTETGMILSNPLHGERRPGTVGQPLPGVKVRIVSKEDPLQILAESDDFGNTKASDKAKEITGDLEVKGLTVFKKYWNKPNATAKEFTKDGWFKTGDTAGFSDGYYKILGRSSVDIIKTGGFKVSALHVETVLLGNEAIADIAVVGVPDVTWGEKIAAVVVLKPEMTLDLPALREWSKAHLAPYSIPTELKIVESIPRNQMGKINKKELVKNLFVTN